MTQKRRDFLKKSLIAGATAGATTLIAKDLTCSTALTDECVLEGSSGVVLGKAVKKEVLYKKNALWEQYYSIAY